MTKYSLLATLIASMGLLLSSAPTSFADSRDSLPRLEGRYHGFFNDLRNDDTRVESVQIGIEEQKFRFFMGKLHLGPDAVIDSIENLFAIRGAVNSRNTALFAGRNRTGRLFGRVEIHDAGFGGAVLEGGMNVRSREQGNLRGTLVLLRPFAELPIEAPTLDASGSYEGTARSAVTGREAKLSVLLRGTGEHAEVVFNTEDREIAFPAGHWSVGGHLQFLAIAQAARGYTVLEGTLSRTSDVAGGLRISGRYKIEPVQADGDTGRFVIDRRPKSPAAE